MDCHQILSGACNAGDRCFAVGSVEGIPFTAYAAGCNIVILASTFERVQIIPGAVHNYIRISSLDCSTDTGKIAAAYEDQVCIFEPTPLIHGNCAHGLEYRWVQTGRLQAESNISALSWNLEGTRLLTGGAVIQMWHQRLTGGGEEDPADHHHGVIFEIGDRESKPVTEEDITQGWECVWRCHTATPVHHMAFSPDGTLFATSGKSDRLVKIWFENKHLLFPSKSLDQAHTLSQYSELNYGFVYIAHPRALTHLSWRKTSKYMPKGSVSNMLVTSCLDNICRVWVETVLPDDGLVNMNQFDALASQNPKFRTDRHKHRFMQRLKHMKTCFHIRRHAKHHGHMPGGFGGLGVPSGMGHGPIPTLPSTYSVHDFHSFGYHGTGVTPGLHFHLAASINAETDIPLVPSMQSNDPSTQPYFILHWLNNKEMHFSLQAEAILQELTRKVVEKEDALAANASGVSSNSNEHTHDNHHEEAQEAHEEPRRKGPRVNKSYSQDESGSDEHQTGGTQTGPHSHPTLSNTTSINSLATDTGGHVTDSLDVKIENLLRDWHHSPDLLFSIHPIDGSFLIWVVEWLDEFHPGSFRQAQVSFSTRIPAAFPLGDAMSMSTTLSLYNTTGCHLHFREMVKAAKPTNPIPVPDLGAEVCTPLPSVIEEAEWESGQGETPNQKTPPNFDTPANNPPQASSGISVTNESIHTIGSGVTDMLTAPPSPVVSMVSKHANGTLNLWQLTFADKSKYSQVLSIGHASRASGHRFRVNDITCHPVLPLLLTTSHHNIPDFPSASSPISGRPHQGMNKNVCAPTGFCSELILWRVDAVGPLCKSGGVSELARINSPEISAFSNVAWIPTLLPSTTLGNLSNSPSACFVASDGESLRVYQAVIDARSLLAEVSTSERRSRMMDSMASLSTDCSSDDGFHLTLHDKIKIVSQQSTARPGCVIQLDAIADATHDWQNTQFLHVFQEQLITGERADDKTPLYDSGDIRQFGSDLGLMESQLGAMVDLQQSSVFEEPFYIVLLERTAKGTTVHMWRIVIASQPESADGLTGSMMYVPDSNLVQDLEEPEPCAPRHSNAGLSGQSEQQPEADTPSSHVSITTTKVCTQDLPLPDGVEVIHASPAAGHLSSSSIYPACFAPYILVTACSDSTVRFWKCKTTKKSTVEQTKAGHKWSYEWGEWEMIRKDQESTIDITGQPLNISAAYSGRIACAYKYGRSFTRPSKSDPESRFVNLCVAIYECESTGGSEWILEDTIHLKNIHLPRIQVDPHLDLSYLYDSRFLQKKQRITTQVLQTLSHEDLRSPRNGEATLSIASTVPETSNGLAKTTAGLLAVPSFSTLQSLRKSITENGNTCPLTQKHLVQLDWVSKEDGSHILTVAVGSKVMLFTPVSSDLAQANMKAMKESQSTNRPILRKASSLAQPHFNDEIRWMKLRKIDLTTADGLPPLPMQMSWVRDGILVVGMDSEMHVYSQWKPSNRDDHGSLLRQEADELYDTRNLRDEDLRTIAQETSQRRLHNVSSMPHLSRVSSINLQMLSNDKKKKSNPNLPAEQSAPSLDYMPDYGLFEASRIACPVLPQYHPKQLMELLNSGKIRWVKAILAHLVRCISGSCSLKAAGGGDEESLTRQRGWSRSRTLSVSYVPGTQSPLEPRSSTTQIPEELTLDYAEITSIPPLPLWTLLAADKETAGMAVQNNDDKQDYNELFDGNLSGEESLDDLLENDTESPRRGDRRQSVPERQGLSHFGPRQGRLLSRLLTHTHLPGLSSLDQMHLLALADTVSTCNTDFAERFAIDAAKTAIAKENLSGIPEGEQIPTDSLDDCGLRFLLAMKHYTYLLRCLPLAQRAHFQRQGVGTTNLVWAFHSESEEELLGVIPSYAKGHPKWSVLKELGVGWWLRSQTLLKTCVERLAKAAYQANQEPLDAAIYYLAMKKKSLVWGLFRSKRDEKMTQFFANNFAEDRWRKAALKNAFALLGKQRFEHAVAFFLLAGALRDAIEVCLNKLEDIQLAMVISRLYEGERDPTPPSLKRLLYEEILGCDAEGNNQDLTRCHPDPFLRSMALWILKEHSNSLNTLLLAHVGHNHPASADDDSTPKQEAQATNPNVFNFYVYLRTHSLLIRQYIASNAQENKKMHVALGGFSYSNNVEAVKRNTNGINKTDKQLLLEDSISPLERQLYFTTAHGHFKAGCPALALHVLSKLPTKVNMDSSTDTDSVVSSPVKIHIQDTQIDTGILDWGSANTVDKKESDWGSPENMDWGAPVSTEKSDDLVLDWDGNRSENSSGTETPPLAMKMDQAKSLGAEQFVSPENGGQLDIMAQQLKFVACLKILMEELSTLATGFEVDGGQLRYQLYIWLEREVDALKQLCNYSVGESDLGNVDDTSTLDINQSSAFDRDTPVFGARSSERPTLHEILMQEKLDFEAKVQRAAKRKRWLKANETLLRTLLSYCSLHGASGGGLASVRMELLLLLQELQQEKTQQQLLSPLPFPTTLPLLSASVACNKTVIADPVRHLQAHTHDMLQTVVELRGPPLGTRLPQLCEVFVLRDLAVALSACIYQSLCDSDTFSIKQAVASEGFQSPGIENLARLNASCHSSHLIGGGHGRRRKYSTDEPLTISTSPSKWPGVTNLRALLARDKDEDTPRLNILLCEAFVANYMALTVYALCTCDCHILYRLVGQHFTNATWGSLFGGGVKKLLRTASTQMQASSIDRESPVPPVTEGTGMWTAVTSLTKQRVRLNMKLLGQFSTQSGGPNMKEDKPTYREQFVPPDMSMVSYFLNKPQPSGDTDECDYDSAESEVSDIEEEEDEEDVFADPLNNDPNAGKAQMALRKHRRENTEHSNPNSYSWCVLRLAIVKVIQGHLTDFLSIAGIEMQELPVSSPLIHGVLRTLSQWQDILKDDLEARGPAPSDYIPGCYVETTATGPAIRKYRSLLEKNNTPFSPILSSASPATRLWSYLVRQESVQEIFIRAVFGKRRSLTTILEPSNISSGTSSVVDGGTPAGSTKPGTGSIHGAERVTTEPSLHLPEPVRIIHKEQDSVSAFCLNQVNGGLLALATPREVQEMDISLLLETPCWLEDECEFDIMNLTRDPEMLPSSSFLVIQTSADKNVLGHSPNSVQNYGQPSSPQPGIAGQSGRGTSVMKGVTFPGSHNARFCQLVVDRSKHLLRPVLKHRIDNIKRMCAHPLMPLYLTGGQDGSVQMWEWGHQQAVCTPRAPGTFAKVTRVRFSQHGNKFGVGDGDGNLSLWQASLASNSNRPFFTYQCHSKGISDFVFLGSCSLVATAGHSSESKNVAMWDSLMPLKKSLVVAFTCHDQGASSLIYAPQHQLLISAGKKGDVCIFDVRQRQLRQRFQAHESPIKCIAMDPHEEHFVTGSADGDIKVWGLSVHMALYSFPGEHARSSFFKNIGQGVTQLHVDSGGRLFSCGADGSMKVRQLPERDLSTVHSLF